MFSLRNLFKKHRNEVRGASSENPVEIEEKGIINLDSDVDPYIRKAASILNIHIPDIIIADIIYEYDKTVCAQVNPDPNKLPPNAAFIGGYYIDGEDRIFVSSKYPNRDIINGTLQFAHHTAPELLYIVIHELRHIWQREYFRDKYYANNAVGTDCLLDDAEIDADAFALSFIFSKSTPFTEKDFPNLMQEIVSHATLDGGKRWNRAKQIADEYHFVEDGKL